MSPSSIVQAEHREACSLQATAAPSRTGDRRSWSACVIVVVTATLGVVPATESGVDLHLDAGVDHAHVDRRPDRHDPRAHGHHGARRHGHPGNDRDHRRRLDGMTTAAELRARFAAARGFPLDPFQEQALDAVDAGRHVLVAAPTGSGKTLIAEYAIEHARAAGGKAFYTTPLKALSNQKYGDLVREYGADSVGLLTGDNSINGDAPVVVMTTEVLRNMIYAASPALDDLSVVVLDEVHYLQDRYRGPVWEEVIVHLDTAVRLVCLSATVSNAEEVAAWIETVRGPTTAVIEEQRPVTLEHRYLVGERGGDALHLMPTFVDDHGRLVPNPDVARLDQRGGRGTGGRDRVDGRGGSNVGDGAAGRTAEEGRRTPLAPAHAEPRRDGRTTRPRRHAAGHRVRVQPRRVRPGGAAVPRRRACTSPTPTNAPVCARSPRRTRSSLPDADLDVLGLPRLARRARGRVRGPPRRHGAADEGSRRRSVRRRTGQGRVRHRDARARASTCRRAPW